ncbi:MAG: hypothetical protein ACKVOE_02265 [Rickettsiales bacterium]
MKAATAPQPAAMSDTMAAKPTAMHKRAPMRGRNKVLLIIFSLLLMAILRTGFVFLIIGLLPSFVAFFMDVSKHRFAFRTIFACNLSGMLPYIGKMLAHGPSSALLQDIMSHGTNWVIIYISALIGWMLIQICPMIAQIFITGLHQTQIGRMKALQKKIEGEWGPEVTQFSHPEDGHHAEH